MNIGPFGYVMLFGYLAALFGTGRLIMSRYFHDYPPLGLLVGSCITGMAVGVPLTYFFSVFLAATGEPLYWGTFAYISVIFSVYMYFRFAPKAGMNFRYIGMKRLGIHDYLIIVFSLVVSFWLMNKTVRGSGDLLSVGSNTVFDFGHATGLMRSMSWGNNFPVVSPFESGAPFFYHFFFYFFTAIWEYAGVPVALAINIPSVITFSLMLVTIYCVTQMLIPAYVMTGWLAVLLTITNSSMAVWKFVGVHGVSGNVLRTIWNLPTYPYAGPFDGSVISIYMTLNNYMNQRHLAFSISLGFFIYLISVYGSGRVRLSRALIAGILTGVLLLWNLAICVVVAAVTGIALILRKEWKSLCIYGISALGVAGVINIPNIPHARLIIDYLLHREVLTTASSKAVEAVWTLPEYLWLNLGLLPFIVAGTFAYMQKSLRTVFLPFVILFTLVCLVAGINHRGFDQKYLSFLIIGINMLAAAGIAQLWNTKKPGIKILSVTAVFLITVSGVFDLVPIKNEFPFPVIHAKNSPMIRWIRNSTEKNSVFVSYADIIDPVVIAGRKNYFGFFGNIGWKDRTQNIQRIYSGDVSLARREHIDYIIFPKPGKSGFPYTVHADILLNSFPVVFEDADYFIVRIIRKASMYYDENSEKISTCSPGIFVPGFLSHSV